MKAEILHERDNSRYFNKPLLEFLAAAAPDSSGEVVLPVRAWLYQSPRGSVVYCSVRIKTRDGRYTSGAGNAGGYGYHKASAALGDALTSAGVRLDSAINGRGDSAMRDALRAVAEAAGYPGATVIES